WVAARPPLEPLDGPGDATVLDTRPIAEFAAGHAPGAISVALDGGSFATRAAFVLEPGAPFVVAARSPDDVERAAQLLRAVGLFDARGYVLGGGPETTATATVAELARLADADGGVQVLDVREDAERDGAPGIPYHRIPAEAGTLDRGRPVYTMCMS